jgi:hypothetical protein
MKIMEVMRIALSLQFNDSLAERVSMNLSKYPPYVVILRFI